MKRTTLALGWGISRGRETAGYTICRVRDTATGKLYRCMGGGYDMVGTVVANWLDEVHQDRLRAIADQAYYKYDADMNLTVNNDGLYGMTAHPDGHVYVDGACGLSAVERIARAAGVTIARATWDRRGNTTAFTAEWPS